MRTFIVRGVRRGTRISGTPTSGLRGLGFGAEVQIGASASPCFFGKSRNHKYNAFLKKNDVVGFPPSSGNSRVKMFALFFPGIRGPKGLYQCTHNKRFFLLDPLPAASSTKPFIILG